MTSVKKRKYKPDKNSYVFYKDYIKPFLNTSEILQKRLLEAYFDGDWNLMRDLVVQGAYINYRYGLTGDTLFFYSDTTEKIKVLVEMGADINAKNANGLSLLGHAIEKYWSIDLVKLLLKCGACVNAQGPYGVSPLGEAVSRRAKVFKKNLELIQLMMEFKANINGTDKYQPSKPLGYAILTDNNCTKILVKYGVLHNAENDCKIIIKSERQKRNTQSYPEVEDFLEACIAEVTLMKQIFVHEKTTLFDYLNRNYNNRLQIDASIDLSRFPIYADVIQETIKRTIYRNQLLMELNAVCFRAHSGEKMIRLNFDTTIEIVDYLDNEDLQSLITAFNNPEMKIN